MSQQREHDIKPISFSKPAKKDNTIRVKVELIVFMLIPIISASLLLSALNQNDHTPINQDKQSNFKYEEQVVLLSNHQNDPDIELATTQMQAIDSFFHAEKIFISELNSRFHKSLKNGTPKATKADKNIIERLKREQSIVQAMAKEKLTELHMQAIYSLSNNSMQPLLDREYYEYKASLQHLETLTAAINQEQ